MKTNARRIFLGTLMTLCLGALGACGGDSSSSGACGRSGNGVTECTGSVGGSCSAGQYCNTAMLTCTPGCTSDTNCASGEACIRASGAAVGACQRCTSTPTAVCGNGTCETGETPATCLQDCHATIPAAVCGNHVCELGETTASCPGDCPVSAGPVCGNRVCEAGETTATCPLDCPPATTSCPNVAGTYLLDNAVGDPGTCESGSSTVTITQAACALTVTGVLPTPLTFSIDAVGAGTTSYNIAGATGTLTFAFTGPTFLVTDTGLHAGCPGLGTRQ